MKKRESIEERARGNIRLLPQYTEYIFDQNAPQVEKLSFGKRGHIGREGCGAVALHNVMRFIGKEQNFCDVLRDMEELDMTWLGARFGTKPLSLGRYFRRYHVPYRRLFSPADFKAALLTNRIGIVNTWNPRFWGMHFYCIYYSSEENTYYTANYHASSGFQPTRLEEISSLRFFVGYIIP